MFNPIVSTVTLAASLAVATPVVAQENHKCAPRSEVVSHLTGTYGETRQNIGLGEKGMMIETFASQITGTWTITVTTPEGLTCLVASGQYWEKLTEEVPIKGEPA